MLIDFGFWGTQPLGFDLSQLILGDVQLGRHPASSLSSLEEAVVPAYLDGPLDEDADVDPGSVRRAHALCMLIFSGLSAIPLEHLDLESTARLHRIAAERATAACFMLDLVDATSSRP